jgi:hypothetical protein
MNVKSLIALLEDMDPELPVYIRANDPDYAFQTLTVDDISIDYVRDVDDEEKDDDIEVKAVCLGEI